MDRPRLDYDRISGSYNSRYADNRLDGIERALAEIASRYGDPRVLEVGCGTGRWLDGLQRVTRSVYGVDASIGMLTQARTLVGPARLVNARANDLPFSGSRFDVIYSVNAIHHFDDPKEFMMNAGRLLRPGGCLATIGIDPRAIRKRYPYDYFEGAFELDIRRYPSFGQLVDWSSEAGLDAVELRIVECSGLKFKGREVLTDRFLGKDSNSLLALLTDEVYERGLAKIHAAIEAHNDVEFDSNLLFGMVTAVKPQ